MIYTTTRQLLAHDRLLRMLSVRTVLCAGAHEEPHDDMEEPPPRPALSRDELKRLERREMPLGLIHRAEIRERTMLSLMHPGVWYSAKYLAHMAGMDEKTFYTHVRRMVTRNQIERRGRRHHFRYRKL